MAVSQVNSTSNYIGLSTDTKPRAEAGSTFYETDTGSSFIIDTIGVWHATENAADILAVLAAALVQQKNTVRAIEKVGDGIERAVIELGLITGIPLEKNERLD
jgi:hypothetical protein